VIELGVNIDHVATLRQARRTYEPDPVWAAVEAHLGGADGITVHLREDRRHIQDEDVRRLRDLVHIKLNLEMAATDEMIGIACQLRPEMAMLVPEGREEVTTEGGLDVAGQETKLRDAIARLADAGIVTSVFIDAELPQHLNAIKGEGKRVLWCCDPMHGNGETLGNGVKTRRFEAIRGELDRAFDVHAACGTRLGGVHLELTGENVTECLGGARDLTEADLARDYKSTVDPRLNCEQSLEIAMLIVRQQNRLTPSASI